MPQVGAVAAPTARDDRIAGTITPDAIAGGRGDDVVVAYAGNDRVLGGAGDDRLSGGSGQDVLRGGQGADRIAGGPDADVLLGGPGDDVIAAAADGVSDGIGCGPGEDVVMADTSDRVGEDCESVARRPALPAHLFWAATRASAPAIARATTTGGDLTGDFIVTQPRRALGGVAVGGPYLFTTDFGGGRIIRTDRDGSDRNGALVSTAAPGGAVAADGWVYWTQAGNQRIGRARWTGKDADAGFITGLRAMPRDITTDGSHLYWTSDQPWISRAAIDGSRVDERFIQLTGRKSLPLGTTGIDTYDGYLYWGAQTLTSGYEIGRARTDGGDVVQSFVRSSSVVGGVAVDGRHLFWTETLRDRVGRADLDGSDANPAFLAKGVLFPQRLSVERVPAGVVSPWTRTLGSVPVGAGPTPPASFTVSNGGNAVLVVGSVALAGADPGDFRVVEDNCSGTRIAPDGSCGIAVAFAPTAAGGRSATVEVSTDGLETPLLRSRVVGTGTAPDASITPPDADFGARAVGGGPGEPLPIAVTSTGTAALRLGQAAVEGADAREFAIGTDTCSGAVLPPGARCTVTIRFDAGRAGPRQAALSVPATGIPVASLTATLQGTGLTAAAAIVPGDTRFPEQRVGTGPSAPRDLTVESVGTTPLRVTGVAIAGAGSGDFAILGDGCTGRRVAVGEGCTVRVTFAATAAGAREAHLRVTSDDPGLGDPAASASLVGDATAAPSRPAPAVQPVPSRVEPPPVAVEGCGPVRLAGLSAADAASQSVNGVRQPLVTRPYDGRMAITGSATCAAGMAVSLWGPELGRRSEVLVGGDGVGGALGGVTRVTTGRIQADGSFSLPADARAPGQYFVTLGEAAPLTGSPLWLRVVPVVSAARSGPRRVVAYAGPPAATAGARVALERRVHGHWREIAHGTVSSRARALLAMPEGDGALRVVLASATHLHSQGDLMTGASAPVR